ncbi:MAG: hypothetical protein FWE02_01980, partial [Defluviitaleaceae bacterium]|nr:hypothetical protein [Defluviitaleaceae bacterium]
MTKRNVLKKRGRNIVVAVLAATMSFSSLPVQAMAYGLENVFGIETDVGSVVHTDDGIDISGDIEADILAEILAEAGIGASLDFDDLSSDEIMALLESYEGVELVPDG